MKINKQTLIEYENYRQAIIELIKEYYGLCDVLGEVHETGIECFRLPEDKEDYLDRFTVEWKFFDDPENYWQMIEQQETIEFEKREQEKEKQEYELYLKLKEKWEKPNEN